MATFRITLVKSTPYRAEAEEEWSNSYYLSGTEPSDATEWVALADAIFAMEGGFINVSTVTTHLTHGYGYSPGSDIAVWSGDFTAGGTSAGVAPDGAGWTTPTTEKLPLAVCALIRAECGLSTSTGKPRYIMKYIHDIPAGLGGGDHVPAVGGTGATRLASMTDGSLPGGAVLCAPDGHLATTPVMRPYSTTHQIKRRGKRPRRGA
jgi:hypothetical protein